MKNKKSLFFSILVFLLSLTLNVAHAASNKVIVAYVTSWSSITPDPTKMTHINYSFGTVNASFNGINIDNATRLQNIVALKSQNPALKVLLSIGGWGSGGFSEMAGTQTNRLAFAADCQRVVVQYGLDGIDIDWEYPGSGAAGISYSANDKANYTLLMRDIRAAIGTSKLLTLASAAGASYYNFTDFLQYVDFINIMAYDLNNAPYHHAALYAGGVVSPSLTCNSAVTAHLNAGIPANKLVLGMPFYGRGTGNFDFMDYINIKTYIGNGYTEKWDDVAKVPYLVSTSNPNTLVCGYDNPTSIAIKCQYIIDRGLLGGMYWDYAGDDAQGTLRNAVYNGLNVATVPTTPFQFTLKVIDKTKGRYTNNVPDLVKDKAVFSWVGQYTTSWVSVGNISNASTWYTNFFDGYIGGKLEKTDNEWIWSFTFTGAAGNYSWNPYLSNGTAGAGTEIAKALGAKGATQNSDFFIAADGTVTGETVLVINSTTSATNGNAAFGDANIQGNNPPFSVTIKVIDRTAGAYTNNVPAAVQNKSIFTWLGTNDANWNWVSTLSNVGVGNWYTNMFDGFTGGKLEKKTDEWVWSYTFTATAGNYSWNPSISTGTVGVENKLTAIFGLKDQSIPNNNIRFTVSSTGVVTGQTVFVIFNNTTATITTKEDEGTVVPAVVNNNGFLKCSGKYIVDGNNNEVLLKGMGLGNYMVLEPYMMGVNSAVTGKSDTQHAMINSLKSIAGATAVDNFLDAYRANYLAKVDVDSLKAWGINSIRLPMHYNLFIQEAIGNDAFIEKGFTMVDNILSWCEANGLYLILDMHAVPGGQGNDKAISDHDTPALWVGDANGTATQYQDKLVVLWKEMARRYANKEMIGGYDLINETNYYGAEMPTSLVNVMKRITTAIRQVDTNHIIFVEGNGYANDHNGLTPTWDNNMAYSFHRYWTGNATANIQWMLDIRNNNNAPLWMGESGENSNQWFSEAIDLLENNKIGWSWWSYKKTSSISAFGSIPRPANWDQVISYLESPTNNGLTAGVLTTALNAFAENTKLQNCKINHDMIYAMLEQPHNNNTKPYSPNILPGKIYATEYDMGRNLFAYSDTEWANYGGGTGSSGNYNQGWAGRNDGVDIQATNDAGGNGFNVGFTVQGEWLKYTVKAQVAGQYFIDARYAVSGTGNITIKVNGVDALANISMANTNAWTTYQTKTLGSVNLNAGQNEIIVYFNAGINLSYLNFTTNVLITGEGEMKNDAKISLYPVPTKNELNISGVNPKNIIVRNTLGTIVSSANNTTKLDVSRLSSGYYFVDIVDVDGKISSSSFIKE